ncbi:MAG: hypothetical protein Q7S05_03790, partial [bacterium]|nr:hypothetical protein [bacterium]
FEITQKQVILSSLGRDSQFAFYTADTGAECALYWDVRSDLHPDTFATSTASVTGETYAREVSCDKESPDVIIDSDTSNTVVSRFQFNLESVYKPEGLCAQVSVKKCVGTFDTDGTCTSDLLKLQTIIHADGYNTDCDSIETNPRALQRSVEIKY